MTNKRKNIPVVIWLVVLFIALTTLVLSTHYKLQKQTEYKGTYELETINKLTVNSAKSNIISFYAEGDEDNDFCYIQNPNELLNTTISNPAISRLNQDITNFLSSQGMSRCRLTITEVISTGPIVTFKATIDNTEQEIEAKYSVLINKFQFILIEE